MIADLQAHNDQLNRYMSEWSKKQQQLLQTISISCQASPTSQILPTSVRDQPESTSCPNAQILIDQQIEETACGPAETSDPEPFEGYRNKVITKMEVTLSSLKGETCLNKDTLTSWLTRALSELEGEIGALEELPEEADAKSPVGNLKTQASEHVLDVLNDEPPKGFHEKIHKMVFNLVHTPHFESVSGVVILFNALVMGISADHQMRNLDGSESSVLNNLETFFFWFYITEFILRFCSKPKRFFIGGDCSWNWFDLALVLLAAYDQLGPLLMPGGGTPNMNVSFLRLLRLLKMLKLLRMIRLMRMFKQLRLIVASVVGSANAVFWAFLLVLVISYAASVLFINLCSNFLLEAKANNLEISPDVRLGIEQYWGSVTTGMKSVFGATTGGDSWFNIVAPLSEIGWACDMLFFLYIGFFLVVILNTFSSLFVQSVFQNANNDDKEVIEAELEKKDMYIHTLKEFFDKMDEDGSGYVTMDEFVANANDPTLYAWLASLEIDVSDAKYFFSILSNEGEYPVDLENFVVGCIQLKGAARSVDLMAVFQLEKQISKKTDACWLMLQGLMQHDVKSTQQMSSGMTMPALFGLVMKVQNRCEEIAGLVRAGNPLPTVDNICKTQERAPGRLEFL